jgi:hypothetical protein
LVGVTFDQESGDLRVFARHARDLPQHVEAVRVNHGAVRLEPNRLQRVDLSVKLQ